MDLENTVREVKTQYTVLADISADNLTAATFIDARNWMKETLEALVKDKFDANDRIVIHYCRDMYDDQLHGLKLRGIQDALNELNIDNSVILIVTTNPNIEQEIEDVSKYAKGPGKINFKLASDYEFFRKMSWQGEEIIQAPRLSF